MISLGVQCSGIRDDNSPDISYLSNFYTRRSCFSQRLISNDPLTLTPNEKEKIYLVLLDRYTTRNLPTKHLYIPEITWPSRYLWLACPVSSTTHYYCLHPITINGNLTSSFSIVFHHFSGSASGFTLSRLHLSTPAILAPSPHSISRRIPILQICSNEICVRAHSRMVERVAFPNHTRMRFDLGQLTHPSHPLRSRHHLLSFVSSFTFFIPPPSTLVFSPRSIVSVHLFCLYRLTIYSSYMCLLLAKTTHCLPTRSYFPTHPPISLFCLFSLSSFPPTNPLSHRSVISHP